MNDVLCAGAGCSTVRTKPTKPAEYIIHTHCRAYGSFTKIAETDVLTNDYNLKRLLVNKLVVYFAFGCQSNFISRTKLVFQL